MSKRPLFGKDSKNEIYATDYVNQGLAGSTANIHEKAEPLVLGFHSPRAYGL